MSYASPGAWPSCPARLFLYLAKAATQVASPGLSKSRRTASTSIWLVFGLILPNCPILRSWFLLLAKFWFSSIISSNNFRNSFASWKHSCWLGLCSCTKQHFCLTFGHATQTKGFHRRHFVYIVSSGGMRNIETWKSLFQTSSCICACYHLSLFTCFFKCGRISQEDSAPPGSSTNIAFGDRGFMITFLVKRPRMHKNLPWRVSFFPAP